MEPQNVEQRPFDADVERIGKEVRARIEAQPPEGGATPHEIIKDVTRPIVYAPQPSPAPQSASSVLPDYAKDFPPASQAHILSFVHLAEEKGVYHAAAAARKTDDAAVVDGFHDALTTKLYDEFKRRGYL